MGAYMSVSTEELQLFHSVDRRLFTKLVTELRRNPGQVIRVIAFWLWLELRGFTSVILAIHTSPTHVINLAYEEAVACISYIDSETPPDPLCNQLSVTLNIVQKGFSLQYLHNNRLDALNGVNDIHARVCARVFEDMVSCQYPGSSGQALNPSATPYSYLNPTAAPFIPSEKNEAESKTSFEVGESSNAMNSESSEERSMFIAFSRGYPVSGRQMCKYFTRKYGEHAVEAIHMQEVAPRLQPLYARVTFRSASTIDEILRGDERVHFVIKGKKVSARRYKPPY